MWQLISVNIRLVGATDTIDDAKITSEGGDINSEVDLDSKM